MICVFVYVGALCTELERRKCGAYVQSLHCVGIVHTLQKHFQCLIVSRGRNHLCSRALVLSKTCISIKVKTVNCKQLCSCVVGTPTAGTPQSVCCVAFHLKMV